MGTVAELAKSLVSIRSVGMFSSVTHSNQRSLCFASPENEFKLLAIV